MTTLTELIGKQAIVGDAQVESALARDIEIPALGGFQCQGDVAITPVALTGVEFPADDNAYWAEVPVEGLAVIGGDTSGAHAHVLVGDPGTVRWIAAHHVPGLGRDFDNDESTEDESAEDETETPEVDPTAGVGFANLIVGFFKATKPAYMLHVEHGGMAFAPGKYSISRQQEWAGERAAFVAD